MNLYNKNTRRRVAILVIIVIIAMVLTMILPYMM